MDLNHSRLPVRKHYQTCAEIFPIKLSLTGDIHPGLPPFALPPFSVTRVDGNNTVVLGFSDICSDLGAAIGLIPLIAILEQVAIAKAFGVFPLLFVKHFYFSQTK